jgi:hypothetical protein
MNLASLEYWSDHMLLAIAIAATIMVPISAFADHRRNRRKHIEAVGFMPWTGITVAAMLIAVIVGAMAYKAG